MSAVNPHACVACGRNRRKHVGLGRCYRCFVALGGETRKAAIRSASGRPSAPKPTPRPRRIVVAKPKTATADRFHPTNPEAAALWRQVLAGRRA